jgi:tetratricopeptide (TPR) repeat protein
MPPLIFSIAAEKETGIHFWRRDALKKLLDKSFSVNLNGTAVEPADRSRFEFGDRKTTKKIYCYLKKLRKKPERNSFNDIVAESFGKLFLANQANTGLFDTALLNDEAILLSVHENESQTLTNIPWELGYSHRDRVYPQQTLPGNTAASLPFGRMINDFTSAATKIESKEQLRVLCCISDPDPSVPLNGVGFFNDIQGIADKYKWLIDFRCLPPDMDADNNLIFRPLMSDLLIEIERFEPHLFILVSHGDSKKGAHIYFSNDQKTAYKWEDINSVAQTLQRSRNCLSGILIACDLTYSPDGYASSSGAMSLLRQGIPSVVAMQTKVLVNAGDIFLDSILSYFTKGASQLPHKHFIHAVGFGRRQIAQSIGVPDRIIDWSFPALFFTADGYDKLSELEKFIDTFTGWLTNLKLFSFTLSRSYLVRQKSESLIKDCIKKKTGSLIVWGEPGSGKSGCLKRVCLDIYNDIKEFQEHRPVIYFDFEDDENETFSDPQRFFDIMNSKIKKVTTFDASPSAKGALFRTIPILNLTPDIEQPNHFARWLDDKPRVFVFDNLTKTQLQALDLYFQSAAHLKKSLVILTKESGPAGNINVPNLDLTEVKEYLKLFAGSAQDETRIEDLAVQLFEFTGGNLLVLSSQPVSAILETPTILEEQPGSILYETKVNNMLQELSAEPVLHDAYIRLVSFPSGIAKGMNTMIGISDEIFNTLIQNRLLIEQYRKGKKPEERISIYKVPKYSRDVIKDKHASLLNEQMQKTMEQIGFYFFKEEDTKTGEEKALELTETASNLDFLRDSIDMFHAMGNTGIADFIMIMIDSRLYEAGQPNLLYHLWGKVLQGLPEEDQTPIGWLRFAKSAQQTGRLSDAIKALDKVDQLFAEAEEIDLVDKVDYFVYRAITLKDTGDSEKKDAIEVYYENALQIINKLLQEQDNKVERELKVKKALVYYNRSIFKKWWKKDSDGAIADITITMEITKPIYSWLYYLSMSEKADMLIDTSVDSQQLSSIKSDLLEAAAYFKKERKMVQFAWTHFRIAKVEKKLYNLNNGKDIANLQAAFNYYDSARQVAQDSFYSHMELIAEAHLLAIRMHVREKSLAISGGSAMNDNELIDHASVLATQLQTRDGIWSKRVARDLLIDLTVFVRTIHPTYTEKIKTLFRKILEYAMSSNFNLNTPSTDRRKAAYILVEYFDFLTNNKDIVELDAIETQYKNDLASWLENMADQTFVENIKNLQPFTQKPNIYG